MTNSNIITKELSNSERMNEAQENVPFMLDYHTNIIKDKLDIIYSLASITRRAEESVEELKQNDSLIKILELIEDIASDFKSVYEIERLLKKLSGQVLEAKNV
jgi:hypothetical protein